MVPISITPQDHDELIALLNLCFREDGGSMLDDYPRHVGLCNQDNIRVIKENGRIVSHIATSVRPVVMGGIPTRVAGVGAVATHPEARGKGYASMLMEDTIMRSEEQGADIMLISNDLNLYKRHNARVCGLFPHVEIQIDEIDQLNGCTVRPVNENDVDQIIKLRKSLSTRYLLPREDIETLIRNKLVMDHPTDWWMVELDDNAVGFGTVFLNGKTVTLLDWAGHPKALHHAAAFWLHHYPVDSFHFDAVDPSILPLDWMNFFKDTIPFEGSVIVLNGMRFMQNAQPYIEERIGTERFSSLQINGDKQQLTIQLNDETVMFKHGGELAECFFGIPHQNPLAEKIAPDSPFYTMLSSFLPLPLVWFGLGYI